MRRRRNAAFLAAVAAGTYVPPPQNGKRRDDPLLPKPMLWDVHIAPGAPGHDPEKGWVEILVRIHNTPTRPMLSIRYLASARSGRHARSHYTAEISAFPACLMVTTTAITLW